MVALVGVVVVGAISLVLFWVLFTITAKRDRIIIISIRIDKTSILVSDKSVLNLLRLVIEAVLGSMAGSLVEISGFF